MIKRKILFFILILIFVCSLAFRFINIKNDNNTNFVWHAKYIWVENENSSDNSNTWTCFRKSFNIDKKRDIKDIVCRIAVDSKYWLYINGEIVVRDGRT